MDVRRDFELQTIGNFACRGPPACAPPSRVDTWVRPYKDNFLFEPNFVFSVILKE